ncbi:type VI protein secretion system component VasK [Amycolatopsis bartoniae]|uniref:Uncharacterized protein n=1 Tax=Amycolatopsis bartoniae TaxID=941986 RepID=A0A8H9ISW8_9PSEU|nr:hypothetical protein [Amycolatopsis bartoniae]MBB2939296.1 type VI protein secretion system component VasK [Amycolatopsis bartoniae]TVT08750.1 hypothetical protein FNH07_11550 [Amycolatopsis bartoniae]GHF37502.1 hypothetical protein GCM10017566_08350 [Amycolatopsis bartoniae]
MSERTRFRFVPATRNSCLLFLLVGVLLLASDIWQLSTQDARVPVFTIIAAVAAVALIVLAVVGLAVPRLRGR